MKQTFRIILAITATMLSGCAWAKFRAYEGGQQEQWPTSQGAFVERNHAIPAYFSPPPRPYRVIGYIDATTAPIRRGGVVARSSRALAQAEQPVAATVGR